MPDETGRRILEMLQENGRTSTAEIGRQLGLAQSAVHERIRKMERRGIIQGYSARLSAEALDRGLIAFVQVRTAGRRQAVEAGRRLAEIDEVQEVHHVAGEDCLLVKVRARDTGDLWNVFGRRFEMIETITSTRTTIVLDTVKETSALPLGPERSRAPRKRTRKASRRR